MIKTKPKKDFYGIGVDIDDLYQIPPMNMTSEQKQEALELFQNDIFYMLEELNDLHNQDFAISQKDVTGQQILKFRRLNKLIGEAVGTAYELVGAKNNKTKKQ